MSIRVGAQCPRIEPQRSVPVAAKLISQLSLNVEAVASRSMLGSSFRLNCKNDINIGIAEGNTNS